MAISWEIDVPQRIVHVTLAGNFTTAEFITVIRQITADPDFAQGFRVLSDHRAVEKFIEPDQIRAVTDQLVIMRAHFLNARWAIVIQDSNLQLGLMRMVEGYASAVPMQVRVFRDEAAARAWLASSNAGSNTSSNKTA